MQIVKSNGSPTVKSLRRAFGIQAHRPSGFNACISAELKGNKYATPAVGTGGRHNKQVRADFKAAVAACKKK